MFGDNQKNLVSCIALAGLVSAGLSVKICGVLRRVFTQVVATLVPCFQQWTGISSIMFYAPIIFKTINPQSGALLATMITGVINVLATFISIALVEKAGRKVLRSSPLALHLVHCQGITPVHVRSCSFSQVA